MGQCLWDLLAVHAILCLSRKDDCSKYRRISFVKNKNEMSFCLHILLNKATNHGHAEKELHCDRGGEFNCSEIWHTPSHLTSQEMQLNERDTALNLGYMPKINGAAEWKNKTIVKLACSMLPTCGLPQSLWANACETAVYLLNHSGPEENKNSREIWTGQPTSILHHLQMFETECYAHIPKNIRQ